MQRSGVRKRAVKGQRAIKSKAVRKTSAPHSTIGRPQEKLVDRLRRERDEVSAEVLKIISSSSGDLKPVFEAMLANALRICDAKFGHLLLYDGERFHATHLHDVPPSYRAYWDRHAPITPNANESLPQVSSARPSLIDCRRTCDSLGRGK
jgi:hypothetical protein